MSKFIIISLCFLVFGLSACGSDSIYATETFPNNSNNESHEDSLKNSMRLKISIGTKVFMASLKNDPTVDAFKEFLPITIKMLELNNNEKYYNLISALPTNPIIPQSVYSGDLMLYGSQTLVLFYKDFKTPYSYTPLGKIDNPVGLASLLGEGDVTVMFELMQE